MSVAAQPLTWDVIRDWPYDPARRFELVEGELVMSPSPVPEHQICVANLTMLLLQHVKQNKLGTVMPAPMDVVLAPNAVFQPDLLFIRADRRSIIHKTHVAGPPDLCVEVISESNRTHDTVVKFHEYARREVAEYWLVDVREREISSWKAGHGRYELIGRARPGEKLPSLVLPGLDLDPASALPAEGPEF